MKNLSEMLIGTHFEPTCSRIRRASELVMQAQLISEDGGRAVLGYEVQDPYRASAARLEEAERLTSRGRGDRIKLMNVRAHELHGDSALGQSLQDPKEVARRHYQEGLQTARRIRHDNNRGGAMMRLQRKLGTLR
jgi:hypothetical protein